MMDGELYGWMIFYETNTIVEININFNIHYWLWNKDTKTKINTQH